MKCSINYLSLSFIDVLPKLEITMFPETPKCCCEPLRGLSVIVLKKSKQTLGHRPRVITSLLDEIPETYSLPNLHRERSVKAYMIKILHRAVASNARQRTLDTLVLKPTPCRYNIPTHAPDHILDLRGDF
jgi:hypothetical protein